MTPLVLPLRDACHEPSVGGKAGNLARLMALDAPVPDGVVLTRHAFDLFASADGLGDKIATLCSTLSAESDVDAIGRAAVTARAWVMAAPLPEAVESSLRQVADTWLAKEMCVVRSSAVGEDGEQSSFAGQFDSVLGVATLTALRDAVRACWASFWGERAIAYRIARGEHAAGMGVVIQCQVDAVAAGVLFTRPPEAGADDDRMIVEFCAGLADQLVAGAIDPARCEVSRSRMVVTRQAVDVEHLLSARRAVDLARLALRLEHALGGPQDIEWTIDSDGRFAIVQTRPITTRGRAAAMDRDGWVLWSNANVNENFPDPVSPLLYSIAAQGYYHYFRNLGLAFGISQRRLAAMDRPLSGIIGVHGARLYYNLTNIHAVLRMAPMGERLAAAFNLFVGVDEMAKQPAHATGWRDGRGRIAQALEIVRIAAATTWQYLFLGRRLARFEEAADAFAGATTREAMATATLPELGVLFNRFLDIRFLRWKNAALCDAAAMVTYSLVQWLLARNGFTDSTHTRLLRALPGVPSSQPPLELWALSRMAREVEPLRQRLLNQASAEEIVACIRNDPRCANVRRAFERYLERWGFRSSRELMLTVPGFDEQPEPLIDLLRQYVTAEGLPPEVAMERQAAQRRRETRQVIWTMARRAPLQAMAAWVLIRWTQRAVAYRERARLKQALVYTRCRRIALAIGDELVRRGQLGHRDSVFMLTFPEVDELTSGRAMFPDGVAALAERRASEHTAMAALAPPDSFRLRAGLVFSARDRVDAVERGIHAEADLLQGVSACGGHISAPAAVLGDVGDAHRLRRGDVLVTRQTDPGWAPVFCLVSGLVIERGGMLSHGAIIAREFGLPCVVGVADAIRRIPHGRRVTIDGDRGTCAIEAAS
jgi:rifampicin phosphotransferase